MKNPAYIEIRYRRIELENRVHGCDDHAYRLEFHVGVRGQNIKKTQTIELLFDRKLIESIDTDAALSWILEVLGDGEQPDDAQIPFSSIPCADGSKRIRRLILLLGKKGEFYVVTKSGAEVHQKIGK